MDTTAASEAPPQGEVAAPKTKTGRLKRFIHLELPDEDDKGWALEMCKDKTQKWRKVMIYTLLAWLLSVISLGLSIGITKEYGSDSYDSHILVAWITVSGALVFVLSIVTATLLFRSPKEAKGSDLEHAVSLSSSRVDGRSEKGRSKNDLSRKHTDSTQGPSRSGPWPARVTTSCRTRSRL